MLSESDREMHCAAFDYRASLVRAVNAVERYSKALPAEPFSLAMLDGCDNETFIASVRKNALDKKRELLACWVLEVMAEYPTLRDWDKKLRAEKNNPTHLKVVK